MWNQKTFIFGLLLLPILQFPPTAAAAEHEKLSVGGQFSLQQTTSEGSTTVNTQDWALKLDYKDSLDLQPDKALTDFNANARFGTSGSAVGVDGSVQSDIFGIRTTGEFKKPYTDPSTANATITGNFSGIYRQLKPGLDLLIVPVEVGMRFEADGDIQRTADFVAGSHATVAYKDEFFGKAGFLHDFTNALTYVEASADFKAAPGVYVELGLKSEDRLYEADFGGTFVPAKKFNELTPTVGVNIPFSLGDSKHAASAQ